MLSSFIAGYNLVSMCAIVFIANFCGMFVANIRITGGTIHTYIRT